MAPAPPESPRPPVQAEVAQQPTPPPKPLSANECEQLARHIVDISVKERPDDQQLGQDEQARLDLRTIVEACQSMRRDTYACALAANGTADMAACDQRTPSSSTSNSSVAPAGMTPPAPRSP